MEYTKEYGPYSPTIFLFISEASPSFYHQYLTIFSIYNMVALRPFFYSRSNF